MEENLITISQTNTWEITRIEDGDEQPTSHTLRSHFSFDLNVFPQLNGMSFDEIDTWLVENHPGERLEGLNKWDGTESSVKI